VEELRQLQRWVAQQMVEQKGDGVAQDLTEQAACQVPQIARPHPLYRVTLGKLRKDGVYPVAKAAKQGTPFGVVISSLGGSMDWSTTEHREVFYVTQALRETCTRG
jgi:hypothetical protein